MKKIEDRKKCKRILKKYQKTMIAFDKEITSKTGIVYDSESEWRMSESENVKEDIVLGYYSDQSISYRFTFYEEGILLESEMFNDTLIRKYYDYSLHEVYLEIFQKVLEQSLSLTELLSSFNNLDNSDTAIFRKIKIKKFINIVDDVVKS